MNKKSPKTDIAAEVEGKMQPLIEDAYLEWAKNPTDSPPSFLCLQSPNVLDDLVNIDVPVFYHRLNSSNVMNSNGKPIAIPQTVKIKREAKVSKWPLVPSESNIPIVYVGIDDEKLLRIRIFEDPGKPLTDTDETKLPIAKRALISALKDDVPRLTWPPHNLTPDEKADVLKKVASITDQNLTIWKEVPVAPLIQNRNTYFPAKPIREIQNTQLQSLSNNETWSTRAKAFVAELRNAMETPSGKL
jgi:hypothetical protein